MPLIALTALLALQTSYPATRAFEAAVMKQSAANDPAGFMRAMPGGETYVANNVPVSFMIKLIYRLNDAQIAGAPDWINSERYEMRGKAEKQSTIDEFHEMFRNLLADRLQFRFHFEPKVQSYLALKLEKDGKLAVNDKPQDFEIPIQNAGRGKINGKRVAIWRLCWWVSQQLNRVVIDQTGLDKNYDFTLSWSPDENAPDAGPSIYTALREQLGLKLESTKGPVDVMVIDRIQRPSAN